MRAADLEVIATARDGADALEKIDKLDPDVVTLDLTMPTVDGLGVLRALEGRVRPRVIVVSMSSIDTELGAVALALGAIDLIAKPTAFASDRLNEIGDELVAKVTAAAEGFRAAAVAPAPAAPPAPLLFPGSIDLVMIGTSTGGPQALTRLMTALPGDTSRADRHGPPYSGGLYGGVGGPARQGECARTSWRPPKAWSWCPGWRCSRARASTPTIKREHGKLRSASPHRTRTDCSCRRSTSCSRAARPRSASTASASF